MLKIWNGEKINECAGTIVLLLKENWDRNSKCSEVIEQYASRNQRLVYIGTSNNINRRCKEFARGKISNCTFRKSLFFLMKNEIKIKDYEQIISDFIKKNLIIKYTTNSEDIGDFKFLDAIFCNGRTRLSPYCTD